VQFLEKLLPPGTFQALPQDFTRYLTRANEQGCLFVATEPMIGEHFTEFPVLHRDFAS
jgi:hypothetical protein